MKAALASGRPLRVAIIGPLTMPNVQGGMSRHCEEIGARLAERGHEVVTYCHSAPEGHAYRGMTLRTVPTIARPGWDRVLTSLLATLRAAAGRFDVVHFHSFASAGFCFLALVSGAGVVVTIHRREWKDRKWGPVSRLLLRWCEHTALRRSHARISVSRTFVEELAPGMPAGSTILYVPNGVSPPTDIDPGPLLQRHGLAAGEYVLCVGRLVPEKGFDTVLEAWARVGTSVERERLELVIVGGARRDLQYADQLYRKVDALPASSPARMLGSLPHEEVDQLYRGARVFVSASHDEGQPLNVLEAMSHGLCVVASDIPAHRELLGDDAAYFPAGDSKALACTLFSILGDPSIRAKLGRRAQQYLEQNDDFQWSRAAAETERILRSVALRERAPLRAMFTGVRSQVERTAWSTALVPRRATAGDRLLPSFLIVGAQKAGTTSLFASLVAHPCVVPPARREIHYFDSRPRSVAWYRAHFPRLDLATREHVAVDRPLTGESSPYYLVHPAVPQRIRDLLLDVRIIVILRDPVARAISGYHHARRHGYEHRPIEDALDPAAAEPTFVSDPAWFDRDDCPVRRRGYLARGRYAEQLERWFATFPPEQLLVLETSLLRSGHAATEAYEFLGLPPKTVAVRERNVANYSDTDDALVARLHEYFAPHNERLFTLLGRRWDWS